MPKYEKNSVDIDKWLKLIRVDGVGPTTFAKLVKHFGVVERALGASVSELTGVDGIGFKTAERIAATRDKFDVEADSIEHARSIVEHEKDYYLNNNSNDCYVSNGIEVK